MDDIATNISAAQIFGNTLYLDLDDVIDDAMLRRMADCVRQLTPAIDRAVPARRSPRLSQSLPTRRSTSAPAS